MRALVLIAATLGLLAGTARAETSGAFMLEPCRGLLIPTPPGKVTTIHEAVLAGRCTGTIAGLAAIGPLLPEARRHCAPPEVATGKRGAIDVVVAYMLKHRDRLQERFVDLVLAALADKWPC